MMAVEVVYQQAQQTFEKARVVHGAAAETRVTTTGEPSRVRGARQWAG